MTKVSIVIPSYNAMAYLPETVANVLEQTYTDFEVLVINDGSTDNTSEWVAQIEDSRIRLVSQTNLGLAGARNTGIREAKGEYLAFLDADDLWSPTKLAQQARALNENPEVGLVYTWVAYIDEQGNSTGKVVNNAYNRSKGNVWQKLTKSNFVECGSVAMVRRECFAKCGVFDCNLGSFVEDWDMWLRIARIYPFEVIEQPLVYYRQVAGSASRNWSAMALSYQLVIEKAFATATWQELPLRNKSYGTANLVLGWKTIQGRVKDLQQASYFRSQALKHNPWLFFSKEYVRLGIAIAIMRWLGPNGYERFLSLFHTLRSRTVLLSR